MDSLVAPYQKIDDEVHSRFLGVEMNYSMDDFGKILEGLGYRKVKSFMMDSLPLIMGNIVDMKHFRSSFI